MPPELIKADNLYEASVSLYVSDDTIIDPSEFSGSGFLYLDTEDIDGDGTDDLYLVTAYHCVYDIKGEDMDIYIGMYDETMSGQVLNLGEDEYITVSADALDLPERDKVEARYNNDYVLIPIDLNNQNNVVELVYIDNTNLSTDVSTGNKITCYGYSLNDFPFFPAHVYFNSSDLVVDDIDYGDTSKLSTRDEITWEILNDPATYFPFRRWQLSRMDKRIPLNGNSGGPCGDVGQGEKDILVGIVSGGEFVGIDGRIIDGRALLERLTWEDIESEVKRINNM